MTATFLHEARPVTPGVPGLLRDLDRPADLVAHLTPNWFAAVMGTGIVAVAAATLPDQVEGLHTAAIAMWALAVVLLVVVTAGTVAHWVRHPATARGHLHHPVMSHFYGAPPMALLTVGAGTLLLGRDVIGSDAAVVVDAVLWCAGTVAGLGVALVVPYLRFARRAVEPGPAFGGWLMPVVPPMVSASTGALLVPHVPAGPARLAMLLACYALFGLALLASVVVMAAIGRQLTGHGPGEARTVPTLWIVLGPLGQAVTAVNLLGGVAHQALPDPYAGALHALGLVFGLPVWALAVLWAGLAAAITVRTARGGLPFGLTWWSFTFPVGTLVTGTTGLARHTGSALLATTAALLFLVLVAAWLTVAARTVHGCYRGTLFLPPPTAPSTPPTPTPTARTSVQSCGLAVSSGAA